MLTNRIPRPKLDELIARDAKHECPPNTKKGNCVTLMAVGNLPTRFGEYQVAAFWNDVDKKEHAAFVRGDVTGMENVPVRLHSECLTGDVAGSLRCDCRDQLEESLTHIGTLDHGIVLYLRQEGRGIGFNNKIRAYQLQDEGLDTVEANLALGFSDDERDYAIAAHMLQALQVKSIRLMTNNPKKIEALKTHGVIVSGRIPIEIMANAHNKRYLSTKKNKSGHLLEQGFE